MLEAAVFQQDLISISGFIRMDHPVDPLKVDAPPVEPVSAENMARFEINKTVILSLLGTFN